MKKKRKIQIPAAAYGIGTNNETQLFGTDYAGLLKLQGDAYTRMNNFRLGMANKDLNAATNFTESLNANDNQFFSDLKGKYGNAGKSVGSTGNPIVDNAGALGEATFNAVGGLMDQFGTKSTAQTGKEVWMQSITDIGTQAANGYNIGKHFGPIGAAGGAIFGAAVGAIGRKGRKPGFNGFTSIDKGTRATGARALLGGNSDYKRELRRVEQNLYNNKAAVQGTAYLANEYAEDYAGMGTNTFAANGGFIPSLAYVDDGELIKTPDGDISKVPERGKPTDSNLVSLPQGSRVLSDKLKVPGTKKTFAELGEEMMSKRKSKFNDRFAENAAKLNEMNNNMIYNLLFALLESIKQLKGIKPKTKQLAQAFDKGGVNKWSYGDDFRYLKDGKYDEGYLNWIKTGLTQDILDRALSLNPQMFSRFRKSNKNYKPTVNQAISWATDYKPSDFHKFAGWMYDNRESLQNPSDTSTVDDGNPLGLGYASPIVMSNEAKSHKSPTQEVNPVGNMRADKTGGANRDNAAGIGGKDKGKGKDKPDKNPFDWGSLLSGIGSLAPIMSNLFTSRPETVDAVYNPYSATISNTLRRRRFDVNPAIQDVLRNRAISRYNISQMNTNTGANLAYALQSAVDTDKAIADLRSQESNINNQYLAEYANTLNNLGQQWVGATNLAADLNAQNRATARNIRRAGLSQLSQWAQNRELMRNSRERDNAMMALYGPFLESGFSSYAFDNFRKYLRKGGNYVG